MHLVDTNVISELMRPRPEGRVLRWAEDQTGFALSLVTRNVGDFDGCGITLLDPFRGG